MQTRTKTTRQNGSLFGEGGKLRRVPGSAGAAPDILKDDPATRGDALSEALRTLVSAPVLGPERRIAGKAKTTKAPRDDTV